MRWLAFVLCFAPAAVFAYGEPDGDGHPNHKERLLHVLTNQVRGEPHAWPDWDTSVASGEARPPLMLHESLFEAARFHAEDMQENGCFQHPSCDGTLFEERLDRFFSGPAGENIYSATGDSRVRPGVTAWMNSDGHRRNILSNTWTHLGTGFVGDRTIFSVQNFGRVDNVDVPVIVGGAFERVGGQLNLIAHTFTNTGPPDEVVAVLDGQRLPLSEVSGLGAQRTLQVETAYPAECQTLVFEATASGQQTRFPTTGALLVGGACESDFSADGGANNPNNPNGPPVIDANTDEGGCRDVAGSRSTWLLVGGLVLIWRRRARVSLTAHLPRG